MSLETGKPFVVGFDGLHRVGKGTQANLLGEFIEEEGKSFIIVRGDGTREGLGETPGDPFSPEWQERSQRLKSYDRTVASWNLSSYILLKELHSIIEDAAAPDVVIVDRTIVSRASFLLHRGILDTSRQATVDELYPNATDEQDVMDAIPDVIFDLQVRGSSVLLDRLDQTDPKYEFRAENIRGGFNASRNAHKYLPDTIKQRVQVLDAQHDPNIIQKYVRDFLLDQDFLNSKSN